MIKKALLTIALGAGVAGNAVAADLTEADVQRIVAEYIQNNGQEIVQSMEKFVRVENLKKANALVRDYSPTQGFPDAQVTVIEFSDYLCGYCKRVQETVNKLRGEYGDRVRFVFKNLPILREESYNAAVAAMAAGEQGKFWEYNSALWDNQGRITDGDKFFRKLAKDLDLDVKKFDKDRESDEIQRRVMQDFQDGRSYELSSTPSFLINGELIQGALPYEDFERFIEAALTSVATKD